MARRILNRKELRADFEADERRRQVEDPDADAAEDEGDEDEDEEEEESAQGEDESGESGESGEEEEEEAVATKKKPAKPKAKAKPKSRSRAAKVVRMRVVWGVFNNSHQQIATYEYPKKDEAIAHAAKLTADKKNTHFVQPVKEPIEEKKES
jgi:hypothetical protein